MFESDEVREDEEDEEDVLDEETDEEDIMPQINPDGSHDRFISSTRMGMNFVDINMHNIFYNNSGTCSAVSVYICCIYF